jgi:hypothetical protein
MSSPKIKKNLRKEFNKFHRETYKFLWEHQFGSEDAGPNKEAVCDDCLYCKNGKCRDLISPEECIEASTDYLTLITFDEALPEASLLIYNLKEKYKDSGVAIILETLEADINKRKASHLNN